MNAPARIAAVDLGASSGRVMVAGIGPDRLELTEVARFDNIPVRTGEVLHWDILAIYRGILDGLRGGGPVASIGVDGWGVDYGLLDGDGRLLGNPVHYRDARTDGVCDRVTQTVPAQDIYAATGVALQPFNTLYQLVASAGDAQLAAAETLLLIPDLITYWLTGTIGAEVTNASTTQLLAAGGSGWAVELLRRLDIRPQLLAPLWHPGTPAGPVRAAVAEATGLAGATPVTVVASHDTASAVAGIPARTDRFAYISCGTWSLVGLELPGPVVTPAARAATFTNEVGVDGTIRFLRNVMGLWLLQECQAQWRRAGLDANLDRLLARAAAAPARRSVVDAADARFLAPGDMVGRIADACRERGQPIPADQGAVVRCILDSLAGGYRDAIRTAVELSGRPVEVVHLVGGGARNALLCQLTADACQLPVLAGPVEAGALGNVLVQARSLGLVGPRLSDLRDLVARTQSLQRYEPRL